MALQVAESGKIQGTRISIYDVMDYLKHDWPPEKIADYLRLSDEQIQTAIAFINDNRLLVEERYQVILERSAKGNPPELQAELDAREPIVRAKMNLIRDQIRRENANGHPSRHPG